MADGDLPAVRRVSATPEMLRVEWSSGAVSEFPSLWLRDNLREDRDPRNGQRLVDVTDLPEDPRIRAAHSANGSVLIEWQSEARPAAFDLAWLAARAAGVVAERPELRRRLWLEGSELVAERDFASLALPAARTDTEARLAWLTRLLQDGIAFLTGVPCEEHAVLGAMTLVGQVAETNYGLVFDVRSVPQPANLAYSDLGLGLHTDNPYREPVPGFQALHALIISPDGGDSLFADGCALAEHLRATAPEAFARLTATSVPFHYRAANAELYAERPLIQLDSQGVVTAVHYNNRSIAPLALPASEVPAFYAAYRRFASLLREPRFQLRLKLAPGELVVFDNQRTLHGRTAFTSARHPRHLQGCYLTRDSVYSVTGLLRRELAATRA
ncbi:MAG: TauD/TfdA family dioxygenase [Steroidobacteraceae bacterium]